MNKIFKSRSRVFSTRPRSTLDDILVLEGKNIVWYSEGGNRRIRQFSFDVEPSDAIFCSFPSINLDLSKIDMAIAVLLSKNHLHVYQINGDHFDIYLDFDVGGICRVRWSVVPMRRRGMG